MSRLRKRYANDLRDHRTLVAVTDNVNQSKGARDPAQWLPRYNKCRYVREWVAAKLTFASFVWGLYARWLADRCSYRRRNRSSR